LLGDSPKRGRRAGDRRGGDDGRHRGWVYGEVVRSLVVAIEVFVEPFVPELLVESHELVVEVGCLKQWHDPASQPLAEIADSDEKWASILESFDCVVLVQDHPDYDIDFIREHATVFIDARDHKFELGKSLTAAERDEPIQVVYTGVVPVVYKAQRTLLNSLVESIGLAFLMISAVMMILLRDWRRRISPFNTINVSAGMTSMIPNVFPVVVIFGAMGHWGVRIDTVARPAGLRFRSLRAEHYDFAVPRDRWDRPAVRALRELLADSGSVRAELTKLGFGSRESD